MEKIIIMVVMFSLAPRVNAQEQELQQLMLNIQKLAQLKSILNNMHKGYEIVHGGYNAVKNVTEGNFDLHKTFLDGLMQVSPVVRNYKRVADIFQCQAAILKEYKAAYNSARASAFIRPGELQYLSAVYSNLLDKSARNLEELSMVLTADKLRMTDDERLRSVDRIADEMADKLGFLRYFNGAVKMQILSREREKEDVETVKKIYGLKQ